MARRLKEELNTCIFCGCTEVTPCMSRVGTCTWSLLKQSAHKGICSHCAAGILYMTANSKTGIQFLAAILAFSVKLTKQK
jgi:hypothetical protein